MSCCKGERKRGGRGGENNQHLACDHHLNSCTAPPFFWHREDSCTVAWGQQYVISLTVLGLEKGRGKKEGAKKYASSTEGAGGEGVW